MIRTNRWKRYLAPLAVSVALLLMLVAISAAQPAAGADPGSTAPRSQSKSAIDFVLAGGMVSYAIILISICGMALVIDSFLRLKEDKLLPPVLVQQAEKLAGQGKFADIFNLCHGNNTMISRIIRSALSQWHFGLPAVREAMQEQGTREITKLSQRVGYIGLIATIAPMLGLLGTVTGMISSFNVLGTSKGTARPDELAAGIAEALVNTCEGLVVAVVLMFFYSYLRDRVTQISQESSGICHRLLRQMSAAVAASQATKKSPEPPSAERAS